MERLTIAGKMIGPTAPVFVIAEAGVNHNGDVELAKQLVRAAKAAGADSVKFQTFCADRLALADAPKACYQKATTDKAESQVEMLRALELPLRAFSEIKAECEKLDILFLSTPYDEEDVDLLDSLGVPAFKIASAMLVEPIFLQYVASKGKPVILSTGMATLGEVDEAIRVIRAAGNKQIVLMQCTTNYPSNPSDANLRAIEAMRTAFQVPVGYSDHTPSSICSIAAVALGACALEKHLTLDKGLPGPDHSSSADPQEFSELVRAIRVTELALGSGFKSPSAAEMVNAPQMRRSLVSRCLIKKGEQISPEKLVLKRPGTGIPPRLMHLVANSVARFDIEPNIALNWSMCEFGRD